MTGRDFAADTLAAIQRQPPRRVVLIARADEGQTVTVVVADADRYEAQRLIRRAGWEHVETSRALSLGDMTRIARAAR